MTSHEDSSNVARVLLDLSPQPANDCLLHHLIEWLDWPASFIGQIQKQLKLIMRKIVSLQSLNEDKNIIEQDVIRSVEFAWVAIVVFQTRTLIETSSCYLDACIRAQDLCIKLSNDKLNFMIKADFTVFLVSEVSAPNAVRCFRVGCATCLVCVFQIAPNT